MKICVKTGDVFRVHRKDKVSRHVRVTRVLKRDRQQLKVMYQVVTKGGKSTARIWYWVEDERCELKRTAWLRFIGGVWCAPHGWEPE